VSGDTKTWLQGVTDFLGNIGAQLRVALSVGIDADTGTRDAQSSVDADLEREPRSDPCVSGSHVRRYVDDSPGYLTSNGRGSLEIGAADD
jgi:hypothetical protein